MDMFSKSNYFFVGRDIPSLWLIKRRRRRKEEKEEEEKEEKEEEEGDGNGYEERARK